MGTSKNGAVLKLRSRVGVLLRRGGGYSDPHLIFVTDATDGVRVNFFWLV